MRELEPQAVRLLNLAQEVCRVRHGRVVAPQDLVFAYVVRQLTPPDESPGYAAQDSASPEHVLLGPEIHAVLTLETDEPVVLGELVDLAAAHCKELIGYLGIE
ncbi:hypothetical protein [Streptomyces qinzhouensis]|uniref:Uncharacterized protein n=1 Tax=Streptomyces qinzhouensis TaxID=2599401 RepID=A0A5B8JBQ3_9ACTN|nr:hypothetical protein [Streptomyces qinzhouensis]QDY77321.1 hypothetical protein FQU76_13230 [Streptomyces qinzhouensis]